MELTAAEPRRKNLTQLYLDGEPGPKIDTEVFLLSRLQPGDVLDQEELQELVARSGEAQLTVVGTRGHGRLASTLLGSVSRSLLQLAEGPVMVVPGRSAEREEHGPRSR